MAETLAGNTENFALRSNNFANVLTLDQIFQRLFETDLNVFVFLLPFLGLELQGELSALPSLRSGQPFARHDRPFSDEDVLRSLFRRDILNDG
jgi:hypothetical protein